MTTPLDDQRSDAGLATAALDETELVRIRGELESDVGRLRAQISAAEHELAESLGQGRDNETGDDVDAGDWALSIVQESGLASNAQDLLRQTVSALARLESGTYGACERCGNPIPVERLRAFPAATMCVPCRADESRER